MGCGVSLRRRERGMAALLIFDLWPVDTYVWWLATLWDPHLRGLSRSVLSIRPLAVREPDWDVPLNSEVIKAILAFQIVDRSLPIGTLYMHTNVFITSCCWDDILVAGRHIYLLLLWWDRDLEEAGEEESKTDAPGGSRRMLMLMMLTLVMTKLAFKILTEQSIPENPGSQTQVFMFEHF